MKPRMYTYPNWNESSTVFDFDDLQEENLIVLCIRANVGEPGQEHDQHKVYIWKGCEFDEEDSEEIITAQEFTQRVMDQYWGCKNPQDQFNILTLHEVSGEETEEFSDFL